jgi:hypothetical protein
MYTYTSTPFNPAHDSVQSPDIIPLFGNDPTPSQLTDEYKNFVSLPLQPYDNNNIYVRGITVESASESFDTAITLRAVPSELILWPQVWTSSSILAPGPIVIKGDDSNERKL